MFTTRPFSCGARSLRLSILVALAVGPGAPVRAQDATVPASPHRVGPVTLAPVIALQDVGIDTNVYNTGPRRVRDLTFTVVPTLNATARVRRVTLSGRSDTQLVYFTQQASERSVNQAVTGTGVLALPRLALTLTSGYLNTRERPSQEIDARSRRTERNGQADLRVRVFPRLTVGMLGRFTETRYEADAAYEGILLGAQLNHRTRAVGGSARYTLTPLTALVVTAEAGRNRFTATPSRNSDSTQFMAGIELQPRALISGSALIGRQRFTARSPDMPSFTGLIGAGTLALRLRPSALLAVTYDRNIYYSYSDLAPYYVRGGFNVSLRRAWSSRWNLQGNVGRFTHRYRYVDRPVINGVRFEADEAIVDAGLGGGYLVRPGTEVVISLGYRRREATSVTRGYDSLRVGTSVSYGF